MKALLLSFAALFLFASCSSPAAEQPLDTEVLQYEGEGYRVSVLSLSEVRSFRPDLPGLPSWNGVEVSYLIELTDSNARISMLRSLASIEGLEDIPAPESDIPIEDYSGGLIADIKKSMDDAPWLLLDGGAGVISAIGLKNADGQKTPERSIVTETFWNKRLPRGAVRLTVQFDLDTSKVPGSAIIGITTVEVPLLVKY